MLCPSGTTDPGVGAAAHAASGCLGQDGASPSQCSPAAHGAHCKRQQLRVLTSCSPVLRRLPETGSLLLHESPAPAARSSPMTSPVTSSLALRCHRAHWNKWLALYVYEYLLHVGAQKSAQTFLSEIRWEKNITLGEPPGFLHSWWWVKRWKGGEFAWQHCTRQQLVGLCMIQCPSTHTAWTLPLNPDPQPPAIPSVLPCSPAGVSLS
ncbi:Single-stranded DNA-binding protein 3 [Chelonia mydas]|uniref:Single-stranded DNA-binding protein 3 n=1 Tax=Chelonia mydas TaxID=8469 RepID=M7B721_CHEMY|nr:Single-stranded DNA-binding protein 3 [Chelonia mydas]